MRDPDSGAAPVTASPLVYTTSDMVVNAPLHQFDQPPMVHMPSGGFQYGKIWRPAKADVDGFDRPATFKFLYNPTSVTTGAELNTAWDWEGQTGMPAPGAGMQTYDFSLFLNRTSDVYYGTIPEGTLHDLEILWRVFNGAPKQIEDGEMSSNLGWIVSSQCTVLLGKYFAFSGYCSSVSIQHEKFGPDMTPVLTEVALRFQRVIAGLGVDGTLWQDTGTGGGGSWGSGAGSSGGSSGNFGQDDPSAGVVPGL